MRAFRPVRSGYEAMADERERLMMIYLATDAVHLLGGDMEELITQRSRTVDPDDPLAAFAAEFSTSRSTIPFDKGYERLVPDMSEDPELAQVLRELTQDTISNAKISNLVTVHEALRSVVPGQDVILIGNEDAGTWLAALNDIRIILAGRLEIDDEASAQAVLTRAETYVKSEQREADAVAQSPNEEDLLAVFYSMVSWWQDSLVNAMRSKALRG